MLRRSFCRWSVIPRAVGNPEVHLGIGAPLHHERLHGVDVVHNAILSKGSTVGGPIGAVGCLLGVGLFGLTYGYNIAVPVMDAYASLEEEEADTSSDTAAEEE
jgi:hypothetical protein